LSRNLALTRFEIRVDHPDDIDLVLSPLRNTLSTISSPAFSEFALNLESYPIGVYYFRLLSGERVWGEEWGLVDRDLNEMVYVMGRDIRLVVLLGAGGGDWSSKLGELVGSVFPLMNLRGLVSVEVAV